VGIPAAVCFVFLCFFFLGENATDIEVVVYRFGVDNSSGASKIDRYDGVYPLER
jgi:hypothetical protein